MKKIITILSFASLLSSPLFAQDPDGDLKFSTTQKLDPELKKIVGVTSLLEIDWNRIVKLPNPPSSALEAQYTLKLQEQIDEGIIERIEAQKDMDFSVMGGELTEKPNTTTLTSILRVELLTVLLHQKLKFDRVRPSYINKNISTIIDVPQHPAYPSGHSTQAHLHAYLFSALDPQNEEKYLALAKDVALNREYAGVHYRSDSYVGKILSKFMIRQLAKNENFQAAFVSAAEEWGGDGITKMQNFLNYGLSKK